MEKSRRAGPFGYAQQFNGSQHIAAARNASLGPQALTPDAIRFSTIVVPEPCSLALLAVALLALGGYRWRSGRSSACRIALARASTPRRRPSLD
jgi:hypothetical protein